MVSHHNKIVEQSTQKCRQYQPFMKVRTASLMFDFMMSSLFTKERSSALTKRSSISTLELCGAEFQITNDWITRSGISIKALPIL